MGFLKDHGSTALSFGSSEISYSYILSASVYFSEIVRNIQSVSPDELPPRIAIIAENRPEWVYALYGIWRASFIALPIDYLSTPEEIGYILKDADVSAIFCSEKTRVAVEKGLELSGKNSALINLDSIKINEKTAAEEFIDPDNDTIAVIIYTSGTTGSPKGVMISFGNIRFLADTLAYGKNGDKNVIYKQDDVVAAILPFHHIYPLAAALIVPFCGGSHVAMVRELTADEILGVCQKYGATRIIGVPRLYSLFHKAIMGQIKKRLIARILFSFARLIGKRKFSKILFATVQKKFGGRVRAFLVGGSKMDVSISKDFETLGFAIMEGYGMTETSPAMTICSEHMYKIGTVGIVFPGGDIKIKDGEFCYKGPNVMKGYFRRPAETAAMFDDEGYLHTGDRAEIDKNGFVTITGRIKEIIVLSNGKNINPEEMENEILSAYTIIKDIGIIENEGILHAVIYPDFQKIRDDIIVNIRETIKWEIIDRYNSKAAHHKKIMDFTIVDHELPRTRIGKLRRFALKDMIAEKIDERIHVAEPEFEEYHILKEKIEDMIGRPVHPGDHIELDLNMDSLDRVELQAQVEATFGFELKVEEISHHPQIADLAEYIKNHRTKNESEKTDWGSILRQKIHFKIPKKTYMMRIMLFIVRPVFWFYLRIKAVGLEKIPRNSAVVFAPNHQSVLDGLILTALFKRRIRKRTYFFAKDRNFNSGIKKFFANRANVILLNINKNLKETLQQMATIADAGNNVVIFPEGARSRDGALMQFKKTFAIISKELGIPVIPVTIDGTYKLFSFGSFFPKPGTIKIRFHDPIFPSDKSYDDIVDITYNTVKSGLK
jgi:long-chain acyl-CoA synthetase